MTKFMDGLYKYFTWIIIALSMLAYFAYQILDFNGEIERVILDWQTWVHVLFVIFLNVTMVSAAFDGGVTYGINSKEFNLADELNNQIITSVNNEMDGFRNFVKNLNHHELQILREDYLFKVGDKQVNELTKKEMKKYNNLKPLRHDIYGFNLPLFYEMSKSGQVKYRASVKKNQGKRRKQFSKVFSSLLYAGMTVNVFFNIGNVGNAFISLLIISCGLIMTYLMTFLPQAFKFKNDLPKKVILKKTLYNSYIAFKNGTHKLKALELVDDPIAETEIVKVDIKPITKDEPIINQLEIDKLPTEELKPNFI